MKLAKRISSFLILGEIFREAAGDNPVSSHAVQLRAAMERQHEVNSWYTPENVIRSVKSLGEMLQPDKINKWLSGYDIENDPVTKKTIAVIMAGNIPLVGFHDILCVLMAGHRILSETSSKDPEMVYEVAELLCSVEPGFKELIEITGKRIEGFDAVIATGSNNTSRYFKYYFGRYPHIFRHNRNSIAIVDKDVTMDELTLLGDDVFSYFGLGCRNVSKLLLSTSFDTSKLTAAWKHWSHIQKHIPYLNNLNHSRALYHVNRELFDDHEFFLLKESDSLTSPVSVIHYRRFSSKNEVEKMIENQLHDIQVIVGKGYFEYGKSQHPEPWDYPDKRDTLQFITSL